MKLNMNGLIATFDEAEVSRIILQHIRGQAAANTSSGTPRIGEPWPGQGGIYAGIMRGRDGAPDYHLIVGPELGEQNWQPAMDAAAAVACDGHNDYRLPYRAEQALQFANVPELFQREWYWSCEQHAAGSNNAWAQVFDGGYQNYWLKGHYAFRARAVRTVPL